MNVADQFKGLPMEDLIGGPLSAAVKASFSLAKSTADFVTQVGFEADVDANGNAKPGKIRNVDFAFEKTGDDGKQEIVRMAVPMLTIVPIPSLQVDIVDITFDMEVKSTTSDTSKLNASASVEASASGGWGPFKAEVKIAGSVSTSKENTRTSDTSAKYHVQVKAGSRDIPEGLARVLDIMHQAIAPANNAAPAPTNP